MTENKIGDEQTKKLAYDISEGVWRVTAELNETQNATITYYRSGAVFRTFRYPAYRIWNISAHFADAIPDLEEAAAQEAALAAAEARGRLRGHTEMIEALRAEADRRRESDGQPTMWAVFSSAADYLESITKEGGRDGAE